MSDINTQATQTAKQDLVLFAGRYPKAMKQQLLQMAADLNYKVLPASIGAFKSGERFCELYPKQHELFAQNKADIAGANLHVVMHMHSNPDKFFLDAINVAETLSENNPAGIHMIMPFAPFARQDRDFDKRVVSKMAKTFPKHLKHAGVDRISTFDMHSKSAEGYYKDNFGTQNVQFLTVADDLRLAAKKLCGAGTQFTVGAPDGGDKPHDVAQVKARLQRDRLIGWTDYPDDRMFFITKRHKAVNTTEVMELRGNVAGTTALMFDDMVDTGGTLCNGGKALKEKEAEKVVALCTHPILSGNSADKLTQADCTLDYLITSDTILGVYDKVRRLPAAQQDMIKIVSCLPQIKHALSWK